MACIIAAFTIFTCNKKAPERPTVIAVQAQIDTLQKSETKFFPVVDSVQVVLRKSKESETKLRKAYNASQNEVKRLSWLLQKPAALHDDTANDLSRQTQIDDLVYSAASADTLCTGIIENLQKQIADHEIIDKAKDSLNAVLRSSFYKAVKQQEILQGYSHILERRARWTRAGKFAWKATAVIAGIFLIKKAIQ